MLIYIIIFSLLLFLVETQTRPNFPLRSKIILFLVGLFICTGYMTGSDWRGYEMEYNDEDSINHYMNSMEFLYSTLVKTSNSLGVPFWHFTISIKLLGYGVFLYVYKKLSPSFYGLVFWFPYFSLFLWINHPARNFVAIILFSISLLFAYKKQIKKYMFFCVAAIGCHFSSIALLPLYFYLNSKNRRNYYVDIAIVIAMYFVSLFLRGYLDSFIGISLFSRLGAYTNEDDYQDTMSLGVFSFVIFTLIIYTYKIDEIRKLTKYADFICKCGILYGFLFAMANVSTILFRLPLNFMIPYSVLVGYVCTLSYRGAFKLTKYVILFFCFYYLVHLVRSDYSYVPYTSYIQYIFQDKPSYSYRFNYNLINSPYRKK